MNSTETEYLHGVVNELRKKHGCAQLQARMAVHNSKRGNVICFIEVTLLLAVINDTAGSPFSSSVFRYSKATYARSDASAKLCRSLTISDC